MVWICFCFGEDQLWIILNGRLTIQIHLGYGRKFLSVGVGQENLPITDGWVCQIGEVFQLLMEIVKD
jgi:hypothetical protein